MSDEIERIVVGEDYITVHGRKPRGICQCGHARAYHAGGLRACQERTVRDIGGHFHLVVCFCMHYVDAAPDPERPRRGCWPWLVAGANIFGCLLCGWGVRFETHGWSVSWIEATLKILGALWMGASLGWFISRSRPK
jgi:hypothetical protein